jgi:hypothetical protein
METDAEKTTRFESILLRHRTAVGIGPGKAIVQKLYRPMQVKYSNRPMDEGARSGLGSGSSQSFMEYCRMEIKLCFRQLYLLIRKLKLVTNLIYGKSPL